MSSSLLAQAKAFLLRAQNADGGWGYAVGHASTVEATAAAVLALAGDDAAADAVARAVGWLLAAQHGDGGWGLTADDPESGWQTAWAVLALARVGVDESALHQGKAWLLSAPLVRIEKAEDIRWAKDILGIDPTLRGWPWLPGQAAWVEPTALALLALVPWADQQEVSLRLDEGMRFLLDRRCGGGGWNVGNPVMFSRPLPPRAIPTAWALLALKQIAPNTIADGDIATLRQEMRRDGSTSALAWGLLALRTLGQDDPAAADRLVALRSAEGGWDASPYHTAIALLALANRRMGE
ncbi:MAG: prenyltransferase/squalene oxidase repeat-containing protein [Anaerolineae bacterium]